MSDDGYKDRLKAASFDWMERAYCRKYDRRLKKDKRMGRREKRSDRNEVRRKLSKLEQP